MYTTEYHRYIFEWYDSPDYPYDREDSQYEGDEPCFKKSIPLDDELKRLKRMWPRGLKFKYL